MFVDNLQKKWKNYFNDLIKILENSLCFDAIAIIINYFANVEDEIDGLNAIIGEYSHLKKNN